MNGADQQVFDANSAMLPCATWSGLPMARIRSRSRSREILTCHPHVNLRPAHGRLPKNYTYKHGPDDLCYTLVFFSTFEVLDLPIKGPMEDAGLVKLYEPSPTPSGCLYVAPAESMVGRVPLIPSSCFLAGNSTPTIPQNFSKRRDSGFPFGCADSADVDGRRGSNLYEVNPWLWQFGRGKPRLGGLTVEQTMARKSAVVDQRHKKAVETKRSRKAAPA